MKKSVSKTLLSNMEISSFCSQMAMILQSGISSFEGISMLLEDSSSPAEKIFLQKIHDTLTETGNFTLALESSGVFPDYAIHMTELGEQSGKLDEVMNSLTLYYEREEHISRSIKSAVSYPLLMIGMMTAIVFILLTKVLPVFNQVFAQFGQEMTGFSGSLLHMGTLLSRYTVGVVVFFFLLAGLILFFSKTSQGKSFS